MTDEDEAPPRGPVRLQDAELDEAPVPTEPETVGTGSYVAVSCVTGMGLLLLVLIVGLLVSRWLG